MVSQAMEQYTNNDEHIQWINFFFRILHFLCVEMRFELKWKWKSISIAFAEKKNKFIWCYWKIRLDTFCFVCGAVRAIRIQICLLFISTDNRMFSSISFLFFCCPVEQKPFFGTCFLVFFLFFLLNIEDPDRLSRNMSIRGNSGRIFVMNMQTLPFVKLNDSYKPECKRESATLYRLHRRIVNLQDLD